MISRELRFAIGSLPRKPLIALVAWSVPEALPASLSGVAVQRAVDTGFLAGHALVGVAWLSGLVFAAAAGGIGSRRCCPSSRSSMADGRCRMGPVRWSFAA